MANSRKFIDRNPLIITAGVQNIFEGESIKECFNHYLVDSLTPLKNGGEVPIENKKMNEREYPGSKHITFDRYAGGRTKMSEILQPSLQSPFQHLMKELRNTNYSSYWKTPLGKPRDQTPNLPSGIDTAFGKPTNRETSVGELVNPPKTYGQIMIEDEQFQELYKKTHNNYMPSEQITRGYTCPYEKTNANGISTPHDPSGIWVPKALHWCQMEDNNIVGKRQAEFENGNKTKLPTLHESGPLKQARYGMRELLTGVEPCLEKRRRDEMLQHINSLRWTLKRRTNMCFPDLLATFKYHDKNLTGSIPLDIIYSVCEELRINIDKPLIQVMLVTLGLINKNNFVDYTIFTQLLNWRHNFPPISKINDIPTKHLNYESSYASACNDRKSIDNSNDAPCGVSSMSRDLSHSTRGLKSDLENLGNETNVMALINPSIYVQYGINHRHFFMPRGKDEIRGIFSKIGIKLPDDLFNVLWQEALTLDRTGAVCIETFRNLLLKLAELNFNNIQSERQVQELRDEL